MNIWTPSLRVRSLSKLEVLIRNICVWLLIVSLLSGERSIWARGFPSFLWQKQKHSISTVNFWCNDQLQDDIQNVPVWLPRMFLSNGRDRENRSGPSQNVNFRGSIWKMASQIFPNSLRIWVQGKNQTSVVELVFAFTLFLSWLLWKLILFTSLLLDGTPRSWVSS